MGPVRTACAGAIACAVTAACGGAAAFECSDHAQCAGAGGAGWCEATGYCSFADAACPSGRRYGARAPKALAEACVEPSDPTSGGDVLDGARVDGPCDDTTGPASGTSSATSLDPTTPVDPSASTGAEATSDGPASESSSSATHDDATSTTGEPVVPPCRPVFVDEFDDDVLDPEWGTWSSAGCSFAEQAGGLEFVIGASDDEWISAGVHTAIHSFVGGQVRAELVPFGPPLDVIGVWLTIFDADGCEVQVAAEASGVRGMSAGVWFDAVPVATDEPLWLQLRVDPDGLVHFEYSSDGATFIEVHDDAPPCDFASAQSAIFAGGTHAEILPITRAIESYERCEAP